RRSPAPRRWYPARSTGQRRSATATGSIRGKRFGPERSSSWRPTASASSAIVFGRASDEPESFRPRRGVTLHLHRRKRVVAFERPVGLDHDRVLVGELLRLRRLDRGGLRSVVQPLWMVGDEGLADSGPREELALVVEEHLVLVDVRMEERHAQGRRVAGL